MFQESSAPIKIKTGAPCNAMFWVKTLATTQDIQSPSITHHCGYSCCSTGAETLKAFRTYVPWALIPTKPPIYSRKDWRQSDDALDWVGILAAHHQLFGLVLSKFTGKPLNGPDRPTNAIRDAAPTTGGWLSDGEEDVGEDVAAVADGAAGDTADKPTVDAAPAESNTAWAEWNQRVKFDMMKWASTKPYERLVLIREVLAIMLGLFAKFLLYSGAKWVQRQEAEACKGNRRSYRILEAARGQDVSATMDALVSALMMEPTALGEHVNGSLRSLRFRMLTSALCSLHFYIRGPRQNLPFSLFLTLDGQCSGLANIPPCMRDPLSTKILSQYQTEEALKSTECQMVLESLAVMYEVDIANIEAKHSTTREFWKLRARGWTPSLEAISSKFCLKHGSNRGPKNTREVTKTATKTETSKRRHKRGGGAWRAFVHHHAKGQKLSADLIRDIAQQYRDLNQDEWLKFSEAGQLATVAHQFGLIPFKREKRQRGHGPTAAVACDTILPPGSIAGSGAVVAMDKLTDDQNHGTWEIAEYQGPTFTDRYLTFKRNLVREKDLVALTSEEDKLLQQWQEDTSTVPLAGDLSKQHSVSGLHGSSNQMCRFGMRCPDAIGLTWKPNTASFTQAGSSANNIQL